MKNEYVVQYWLGEERRSHYAHFESGDEGLRRAEEYMRKILANCATVRCASITYVTATGRFVDVFGTPYIYEYELKERK